MKMKKHYRRFDLEASKTDTGNRTVELSFSSEEPIARSDLPNGALYEVLDHSPEAVDLSRLRAEGSVLRNHDENLLCGKIIQVFISEHRGFATVRLASTDLGNELWTLITQKIQTSVSVGYQVIRGTIEGEVMRVLNWLPTEISFVSLAADTTIGVGRDLDSENEFTLEVTDMTTEKDSPLTIQKNERTRIADISAMCRDFNIDSSIEKAAIEEGREVDEVRKLVLEQMGNQRHISQKPLTASTGLSKRDIISKELDTYVRSRGETRGMSISGAAGSGGEVVIPYTDSNIENMLRDASPIRDLVDVVAVKGNSGFDEVISSNVPGSLFIDENTTARSETENPVLNKLSTVLKEIYSEQFLTQRLIDQSFANMGDWIMGRMSQSIAELESDAFVNGSGVGVEPPGLLSYPITTEADDVRDWGTLQYTPSGAASTMEDPDKLIELFYTLKAGYRSRSTWLMNSNSARVLMQMKDGANNYLWNMGDVQGGQPASFLGRPVTILEDLPDIGADAFPVWVGDWSEAIRFINGGDMSMQVDPYTVKPNVSFYSYYYLGFGLRSSDAIKSLKISTT